MTPVVTGAAAAFAVPAAIVATVILTRLVPAALRRRPARR